MLRWVMIAEGLSDLKAISNDTSTSYPSVSKYNIDTTYFPRKSHLFYTLYPYTLDNSTHWNN